MTRLGSRDGAGFDDIVERTLRRARQAREPSAADRERVLTSLRDYIDDPTGAAPHEDGAASGVRQIDEEAARQAVSQPAQPVAAAGRLARPWSKLAPSLQKLSLQKLVGVGVVTGGLGFWLGSQPPPVAVAPRPVTPAPALVREAPSVTLPAPSLEPASGTGGYATPLPLTPLPLTPLPSRGAAGSLAAPGALADPSALAEPGAAAASAAMAAPSAAALPPSRPAKRRAALATPPLSAPALATPSAAPAPAPLAPERPREPGSENAAFTAPMGSQRPRAHATPAPAEDPPPAFASSREGPAALPTAPAAGDPGFLEAVRMIQRAQRSLERGAPHTALSLLDRLDLRFPPALLNEERLTTRVLALCATGASARARPVAAELVGRNPSSIYAARIAQSCAGPGPGAAPAPPRR